MTESRPTAPPPGGPGRADDIAFGALALSFFLVLPLGLPGAPLLMMGIIYIAGGLVVRRIMRPRHGPRWWASRPRSTRHWGWALLAIPLLVFEIYSMRLLLAGASQWFPDAVARIVERAEAMSLDPAGPWAAVMVVVSVGLAPVVEEFLFRKLLLEALIPRIGLRWAILAQAALFGLFHFLFLGSFVFGIFAALLYLHTRCIWVAVAFHALNNTVSVAAELLAAPPLADIEPGLSVGITDAALALAAGSLLLWAFFRLRP